MINRLFAERCVELMNELLALDPDFVLALCERRLPCNQALATHPTVQVVSEGEAGPHQVGLLGILNGLCGSYDDGKYKNWGCVIADYDDNTRITGFRILENKESADGKLGL